MKNHYFTIFTPCYNGAYTIQRVFTSVENQTYGNFEWIIINDGSVDASDAVIRRLIEKSPVKEKIRYFTQENQGKHRAWNKAVSCAGGIFIPADADDSFVPTTLEYFNNRLNQIETEYGNLERFSGINVCVYDPKTKKPYGTPYPKDGLVSDNVELAYRYKIKGEHWGCIRTDLLKRYKFPEVKGHFYTENRLWFLFAKKGYKVVCYNDCLRARYYESDSLTHNHSYRWDFNRNAMYLRYALWAIRNLGWRIMGYSPSGYLRLWKQVGTSSARCVLSFLLRAK